MHLKQCLAYRRHYISASKCNINDDYYFCERWIRKKRVLWQLTQLIDKRQQGSERRVGRGDRCKWYVSGRLAGLKHQQSGGRAWFEREGAIRITLLFCVTVEPGEFNFGFGIRLRRGLALVLLFSNWHFWKNSLTSLRSRFFILERKQYQVLSQSVLWDKWDRDV